MPGLTTGTLAPIGSDTLRSPARPTAPAPTSYAVSPSACASPRSGASC